MNKMYRGTALDDQFDPIEFSEVFSQLKEDVDEFVKLCGQPPLLMEKQDTSDCHTYDSILDEPIDYGDEDDA